MPSFRYFPPGPEEQKNFALQFLGTLLCLAMAAVLFYLAPDTRLRAVLLGAGLGVLWLLGRAAWQLETKALRAQKAEIVIDEQGVLFIAARGQSQRVLWNEITDLEVQGGRLTIAWPQGKFAVGAREIENGMELVREITQRHTRSSARSEAWQPPTNFIPLEPR